MEREINFLEQVPDSRELFIYGAGALGSFAFEGLTQRGFEVAGFIDSHAGGMAHGRRVWTLDEYAPVHGPDKAVLIASSFLPDIIAALADKGINDWFDLRPAYAAHLNRRSQLFRPAPDSFDRAAYVRSKISTFDVVETIGRTLGPAAHRLAVNFGCNDGQMGDPCHPLFAAGYGGLCVDVIETPDIFANLPGKNVIKHMGCQITPMNVAGLLRDARLPVDFDLLKIDIDSIDGVILAAALAAGYRPNVIQIEVSNELPPPFKFAALYHRLYHTHASAGSYGFYGCSLGYANDLAERHGYALLQVDFSEYRDAVFVRREFLDLFPPRPFADPRAAFLAEPNQFSHMFNDFGIDVSQWWAREDYHVLAGEIWNAYVLAGQARFGIVAPFHFSY